MKNRVPTGIVVLGGMGLLLTLFGCQTAKSSGQLSPLPQQLGWAAERTYANYVKAVRMGQETAQEDIPAKYWEAPIKALNPIKVYPHRINLVVVQGMDHGMERGKYIYNPISSYLPHSGDDGFVFTPNPRKGNQYNLGTGVFDFRRTTGKSNGTIR